VCCDVAHHNTSKAFSINIGLLLLFPRFLKSFFLRPSCFKSQGVVRSSLSVNSKSFKLPQICFHAAANGEWNIIEKCELFEILSKHFLLKRKSSSEIIWPFSNYFPRWMFSLDVLKHSREIRQMGHWPALNPSYSKLIIDGKILSYSKFLKAMGFKEFSSSATQRRSWNRFLVSLRGVTVAL